MPAHAQSEAVLRGRLPHRLDVYPEREVNVLEASGAGRLLKGDDLLEAPELLPGFSVPVSELFEE